MAVTLVQPERTSDVDLLYRQLQQTHGLLTGQADWASDVHLLEDLTVGGTLVVGSTLTLVDLVVTQNSILGDTAADTVTVNATSTFGADVTLTGGLTVGGSATFGNVNATGNVTLGNAAGDALTVNATGTFQAPVTFNGTLAAAATSVTTLTASSTVQGTRLISTVATGTAPLTVASTTVVPNLNASLLGGHPVSDFALVAGAYLDASGTGQTKAGALTIQGTFATEGDTVVGSDVFDTVTVNGVTTLNSAATFNGNVTVGNASTDALTVVATASFDNGVTLGSSAADALTVNAAAAFNGAATFQAAVVANDAVTLGSNSADALTVNATTTFNAAATATTLAATTYLAAGPSPATTGLVRMANNDGAYFRNAANSANVKSLVLDGSNDLTLGNTGNLNDLHLASPNTTYLYGGGNIRIEANATGLGFFTQPPVARPTVSGSRGGNAALADLCSELANLGLIIDSTSA
jgi:hypothetical protein